MPTSRTLRSLVLIGLLALLPRVVAGAAPSEAVPGQLDVLQGTAVQLGGQSEEDGPTPVSYRWSIVQGEGGHLFDADKSTAIFLAPTIEQAQELFVVELDARYADDRHGITRLHLRVHRDDPEDEEDGDGPAWLVDYYDQLEERKQQQSVQRTYQLNQLATVAVNRWAYPSWHFGVTVGWGGFVRYPVYIPIVIAPGRTSSAGSGSWIEPSPIPYKQMINTFPGEIAERYSPEDDPLYGREEAEDEPEPESESEPETP